MKDTDAMKELKAADELLPSLFIELCHLLASFHGKFNPVVEDYQVKTKQILKTGSTSEETAYLSEEIRLEDCLHFFS